MIPAVARINATSNASTATTWDIMPPNVVASIGMRRQISPKTKRKNLQCY